MFYITNTVISTFFLHSNVICTSKGFIVLWIFIHKHRPTTVVYQCGFHTCELPCLDQGCKITLISAYPHNSGPQVTFWVRFRIKNCKVDLPQRRRVGPRPKDQQVRISSWFVVCDPRGTPSGLMVDGKRTSLISCFYIVNIICLLGIGTISAGVCAPFTADSCITLVKQLIKQIRCARTKPCFCTQ